MKKQYVPKTSIKELKTTGTPSLEKVSLDELSYVGGGLQVATDDRLNSITLVGEPRQVEIATTF